MNWPTFVASFPASIPELEVRKEFNNVLCSSEGLAWQSDKKYKRTVTRVNDLHKNAVLEISNGVQKVLCAGALLQEPICGIKLDGVGPVDNRPSTE